MSHRLEWILSERQGRAIVMDGDLYFSPNSTRQLLSLPSIYNPVRFQERVSTSADFQEPRWWCDTTEWMGFVPRKPVPYIGSWFAPLAIIPNRLLREAGSLYGLARFHHEEWMNIDFMLWETCEILRKDHSLRYVQPFPPRRWGYHKPYATFSAAMEHITNARDWFAMWIGLLYWSTRKVPNGPDFAEGLSPPTWFYTVVQKRTDRRRIDAIRTSQLLQNWWLIDRVGLLLHHPDDIPNQPGAQWFVDQSVPVWYRWGPREKRSAYSSSFTHIQPSPEHLQNATTWITPAPSSQEHPNDHRSMQSQHYDSPDYFSQMAPQPHDTYIEMEYSPMSPQDSFRPLTPNPPSPVTTMPSSSADVETDSEGPRQQVKFSKDGDPIWHYGSGRSVWEPFFEQQKKRHDRILAKEAPKAKHARLNRLRQPPTSSAPVFVWDWNDDTPPKFVRTPVLKADRLDTLSEYSPAQQRYNAFDNEWDCCREWGENLDDDEPRSDCPLPPIHDGTPKVPQDDSSSPEWMAARLTQEVERILYRCFGFVAPIPLPSSGDTPATPEEKKTLVSVVGLYNISLSNPFFDSPLARAAYTYLKPFTSKDSQARPPPDLWDLAEENRRTLVYSMRFNAIRTIRRDSETWYMFDYAPSDRAVTWNIAVSTPAAAFYVARLKDDLSDTAVAHELIMEGIRFHTVQSRDTLEDAGRELPASVDIPIFLGDHAFTRDDYNMYREQCRDILASPRGRAALMRGGFIRRVALGLVKPADVLRGPWGIHEREDYMFVAKDLAGTEYVDDELTNEEYDILSGLYRIFLGEKREVVSVCWYPLAHVFDRSGVNVIRWSDHLEGLWEKRSKSILDDKLDRNTLRDPLNVMDWRNRLRGHADTRRALAKLDKLSGEVWHQRLGGL